MTLDILSTKAKHTTKILFDQSILNRISVTKPYFALKNLTCFDNYIHADFTTELINIDEAGPISAAEVGRHMAILGSIVLSKENPKLERHHYLATDAIIKRHQSKNTNNSNLHARAKLVSLNRKKGIIKGEILLPDTSVLYSVEVSYMVLVNTIFDRMFSEHRNETSFDPNVNPYKEDIVFKNLKIDMKSCSASIGIVKPEHCPGHFKNYPALPVARMGTSMGKIGGIHFMHLNPSDKNKYTIKSAELHAKQLVFTGEEVMFRTEIVDPNAEQGMVIRTIAFTNRCDFIAESICNYHY